MFGVSQRELIEGLEKTRKGVCAYMSTTCDCKYGGPEINDYIGGINHRKSGEQTGCPEIRMAIAMLSNLSPDEFRDLAMKSGIMDIDEFGQMLSKDFVDQNRFEPTY